MASRSQPFRRIEHGWYRGTPGTDAIAWALAQETALDAVKPNDFVNFSNRRWQGFLAERAFDRWLEQLGVPRVWNGGADPDPDFVVAGVGTGLKSRGFTTSWRPNFVVNVFDRHRAHPEEVELFFTAVQRPKSGTTATAVLLLGGLPQAEYFARATEVKPGEMINPLEVAKNHVWNLECRLLEPPDEWLARVISAAN